MLAPASSTHFSWSLKICSFIMVIALNALNKILQGDYRLNNCLNNSNRFSKGTIVKRYSPRKISSNESRTFIMIKVPRFNDLEACVELAGAGIAIFLIN